MRGAGRQGQAGAVGARVGARCGLGWQMRAPFWGVGGSVPGWRCRRSERVLARWVDLGAEAIEPVPKRRAIGRTQHRRGPEESRQGRTARVAAWGLRHGGPGVRQSVIRTLEGGGGGRGRGAGGGGGPEESNYVTPQQGLPHTDIAPPLTHRPARPALSPSLAPCPDGPPSPHRPDPAPDVSAPSHEAHRPHRRPQTRPSSPRPTHTDRLCQQATAASRLPTDQATNHARPNPRQEATARSPVRRRHASPYGTGTPTPTTSRSPRHRPRPHPGQPSRHPPQPHQARLNGSPEQPCSGPPTEPSPGRNLRGSVHDGDGERAPGAQ